MSNGLLGWSGPSAWPAGIVKVAEIILPNSQAAIDFTNIPQCFRHLRLMGQARGDVAGSNTTILIQINGDTGGNYDEQLGQFQAATPAASENFAQTSVLLIHMAGSTAPANSATAFETIFQNYAGTTFRKTWVTQGVLDFGNSGNGRIVYHNNGVWRSTAAINAIHLVPASGNFVAGSTFSLYGVA